MGSPSKRLGSAVRTTKAQFSSPSERFIHDWDSRAGVEQALTRTDARAAMGEKKTPIGRGTLRRPAR